MSCIKKDIFFLKQFAKFEKQLTARKHLLNLNKKFAERFGGVRSLNILFSSLRVAPVTGNLDFVHGSTVLGGLGGPAALHAMLREASIVDVYRAQAVHQIFHCTGISNLLGSMGESGILRLTLRNNRPLVSAKELEIFQRQSHWAMV
jgi:hypothetical protein